MSGDDEVEQGITRRSLLKGALAVGAASVAVPSGYAALQTLAGPGSSAPIPHETFRYVSPEGAQAPVWFAEKGLVGKEARWSHFREGEGANVQWRWHLGEGGRVEGLPALLMRVDDEKLEFPEDYPRDEFVVDGLYAVFNLCPHAGCWPGWQLVPREEQCDDPGFDTIFCPCHYSHFHPTRVSIFTHPNPPEASGAQYLGVAEISGPSGRGMPLIPLEVQDDLIIGKLKEPSWYQYLDYGRRLRL
ncbi:MAG: hypothetical protein ACE5LS_06540 [Thermoplasmata archaeon]